eukprot:TRINITY_DN2147_c0_g1_i1.p1 TRINITY_DN2147_c0_g1~~TRINITY_DN2147_c0_g1_i1.p1  ORF type:complete len:489 (+),score=128.31 TRINITY_DN2147_c0_g1_i1:110-1576(+)
MALLWTQRLRFFSFGDGARGMVSNMSLLTSSISARTSSSSSVSRSSLFVRCSWLHHRSSLHREIVARPSNRCDGNTSFLTTTTRTMSSQSSNESQSQDQQQHSSSSSSSSSFKTIATAAALVGLSTAAFYYFRGDQILHNNNNNSTNKEEVSEDSRSDQKTSAETIIDVEGQVVGGFPTYETKEDVMEWLSFYDYHPQPDLVPRALQLLFSGPLVKPKAEDNDNNNNYSRLRRPYDLTTEDVSICTGIVVGLFDRYPERLNSWITESLQLNEMSADKKRWLCALLWNSGSEQAMNVLEALSTTAEGRTQPLLDDTNVRLVQKLLKTPPPNILSPALDFNNPIVTKPSPMTLHAIRALSGYFMATSHPPSLSKLVSIASLFFQDKLPITTTSTTTSTTAATDDSTTPSQRDLNLNEIAVGNAACTELIKLCLFHPKAFAVCVEMYNQLCDDSELNNNSNNTHLDLQKIADRITLEHVIIETLNLKNQTV